MSRVLLIEISRSEYRYKFKSLRARAFRSKVVVERSRFLAKASTLKTFYSYSDLKVSNNKASTGNRSTFH